MQHVNSPSISTVMTTSSNPTPSLETPYHRRVQSDTSYKFSPSFGMKEEGDDEDFSFLMDLDTDQYLNFDAFDNASDEPGDNSAELFPSLPPPPPLPPLPPHMRSVSVDGGLFEGVSIAEVAGGSSGDVRLKKPMSPEELTRLSIHDPLRVKRILSNRQSAIRSKEKKTRYTNELERQLKALETQVATLSSQLIVLEKDTSGLTAENKELKLRLKALEKQAKLRESLNESLRNEIKLRKAAAGKPTTNNGFSSRSVLPQFPPQVQNSAQFGIQNQQPQPQPQQRLFQVPNQNHQQQQQFQMSSRNHKQQQFQMPKPSHQHQQQKLQMPNQNHQQQRHQLQMPYQNHQQQQQMLKMPKKNQNQPSVGPSLMKPNLNFNRQT